MCIRSGFVVFSRPKYQVMLGYNYVIFASLHFKQKKIRHSELFRAEVKIESTYQHIRIHQHKYSALFLYRRKWFLHNGKRKTEISLHCGEKIRDQKRTNEGTRKNRNKRRKKEKLLKCIKMNDKRKAWVCLHERYFSCFCCFNAFARLDNVLFIAVWLNVCVCESEYI